MKSIYTIIIFYGCLSVSITAQNVRIYEIQTNGTKGNLIRTEQFQNNLLTQTSQYDENNQLEFVISKQYNDKNQLIKEIKTFKKEHEYDLVTEYYYDYEGRKSGVLEGNNLTGKWYSERYLYNTNNDLDTIFFYEKNGERAY